jgi:4-oxalocrotonate tautomerase
MPHIVLDGPRLTKEQKREIVEKFTEIASEVTKIPKEAFVVMIKENDPDNVGVGGKLLSERMQRES